MTVLGDPLVVGNTLYLFEDGKGDLPDSGKTRAEHRFSQLDLTKGAVTQLLRDNELYTWRIEGETVFFFDQNERQFKELDLTAGELVLFLATEEALYFRSGEEVYYLERSDVGSSHLKPQLLGGDF